MSLSSCCEMCNNCTRAQKAELIHNYDVILQRNYTVLAWCAGGGECRCGQAWICMAQIFLIMHHMAYFSYATYRMGTWHTLLLWVSCLLLDMTIIGGHDISFCSGFVFSFWLFYWCFHQFDMPSEMNKASLAKIQNIVRPNLFLFNSTLHASPRAPLLGPGFAVEESSKLVPASVFPPADLITSSFMR